MQTSREIHASNDLGDLGRLAASLSGTCIGCESCAGLCNALVEALTVPGFVLKDLRS